MRNKILTAGTILIIWLINLSAIAIGRESVSETTRLAKTKLDAESGTMQKVIALTFDACGGSVRGCGYDSKLIDYLEKENIPATLFLSGRWIASNPFIFLRLARNPLFEIENHGFNHKPCSASGRLIYGIKGTDGAEEVAEEIEKNADRIWLLTGNRTKYYRPAACYCDETAAQIVKSLGYEIVNFSVLGDAGATYSKAQVKKTLLSASPGSIVIFHMNHPESETAEGIIEVIPLLRQKGFRFAKLKEYNLK
jgi:peptidoglycan/xylan/chitin deacetylase (PgdA/CDA1 family)